MTEMTKAERADIQRLISNTAKLATAHAKVLNR